MRRLITLISAGRNRTVMIRRELPRTKDAGWVRRPDRIEDRRILLSVSSLPVTRAASAMSLLKPPLVKWAGQVSRRSVVACSQHMPNLFTRHLVRLRLRSQIEHLERTLGPQPSGDRGGGAPPSGIAIQHEDHVLETLEEQALLRLVQDRSHQCDHRMHTGLVQLEAVEETLDHHHGEFGRSRGAMAIKQDFRFGETRRKAVARFGMIQCATAVADQLAPLVVDGDDQPAAEDSWSSIRTYTELLGSAPLNTSRRQVSVRAVDAVQSEAERCRCASFFRNQLLSILAGRSRLAQDADLLLQMQSRLSQAASFHGGDEVQHAAAGAARETVKDVLAQIGVKGFLAFTAMNGTRATILIAAAAAQLHPVPLQQRRQRNAALDGCKIHPVAHHRLPCLH